MKKLRLLSAITALAALLPALGASTTLAAPQEAPGPTASFQGTYPLTVAAGDYDLTYLVLDFAPGAEIPLHYHGGPALVVDMVGMLTLRPEGAPEHMLMPGDVMNEEAGAKHVMINTGTDPARVLAVVLLPKGAQLTTVVDTSPNPPPGPTLPFHGDYPLTVAAGDYDLTNLVLDFAPGAEIPLHYHGGPVVVVGMDGTLTLRPEGAPEMLVKPGDVMNEEAGAKHVMINNSNANARILAGVLLPKGAELTTVVTQASPPSQPTGMPVTGSGDTTGIAFLLVLLASLLLVLGTSARFAQARNR
ncbi:MAG: cupin domain-containing protein [Chloroflexota bacterium]